MHRLSITGMICIVASFLVCGQASAEKSHVFENSDMIAAAIENGRLVQASAMLANMKSEVGVNPELDLLEAELALARNNDDTAMRIFHNYLGHPALACRAREGTGIIDVRSGRMRAAAERLAVVNLQCPSRWKSWNMMGVVLAHFKKWDASKHAFEKALILSHNSPKVLNNLGFSLMTQKKFSKAQIQFTAALGQQPDNTRFQNNLDIARAAMGEKPLKSGSESDRRWSERLNNSGHAARLAGHEEVGIALLTEAVLGSSTLASVAASNLVSDPSDASNP